MRRSEDVKKMYQKHEGNIYTRISEALDMREDLYEKIFPKREGNIYMRISEAVKKMYHQ